MMAPFGNVFLVYSCFSAETCAFEKSGNSFLKASIIHTPIIRVHIRAWSGECPCLEQYLYQCISEMECCSRRYVHSLRHVPEEKNPRTLKHPEANKGPENTCIKYGIKWASRAV